jgi:hypothetical protein
MSKFNKKTYGNHWWPIKQFRFDTSKHPVIKSSRGRPASVPLTYKEKQMLEGLARILQCDEQTALRIAVYEFQQSQPYLRPSIIEGATALVDRKKTAPVSLTSALTKEQEKVAKTIGVTYKQSLRVALVWLCRGIRDESITHLTKSRRIGQNVLAQQWKETGDNAKKKGVLQNLHRAQQNSWEQAAEEGQIRDDEIYEARGEFVKANGLHHLWGNDGMGNKWMDTYEVDRQMASAKEEALIEQGADLREHRLQDYMDMGMTKEEAEECLAIEDEEDKELTDEEMEELDYEFEMPVLTDEQKAEIAKRNEEMTRQIIREIEWEAQR